MDPRLAAKSGAITVILRNLGSVVVAYSGGVDSSVVAELAHRTLGPRALIATALSPAVAERERTAALVQAQERGWNHRTIATHELARAGYVANAPDRCFWCKTELFETLKPLATQRAATIVTGTNADDLGDHRPGLRAAAQNGVRAPLADAGCTKPDVRALARALGLSTAEKPASPCLASRFAYGVVVTEEGLSRIEAAEEVLAELGFNELRVRDHGDLARIEVPAGEIERAATLHRVIADRLKQLGFVYVTLDLAGFRSGSLNAVLLNPRVPGRN